MSLNISPIRLFKQQDRRPKHRAAGSKQGNKKNDDLKLNESLFGFWDLSLHTLYYLDDHSVHANHQKQLLVTMLKRAIIWGWTNSQCFKNGKKCKIKLTSKPQWLVKKNTFNLAFRASA